MADQLEKFRKEFARIWRVMGGINWADLRFTPEKAYACALFSKIAYLHVPAFEAKGDRLAKIIPCLTHQSLVASGRRVDIEAFMRRADFPTVFVVEDDYLVAVGVCRPDVIVVALRGTRLLFLSDWMIDLHAWPFRVYPDGDPVSFHKGFYLALTKCLDRVSMEIDRHRGGAAVPVYVTGHSLGGAMAAIMFALGGKTFYARYLYETIGQPIISTQSSYTFGMPRYGDRRAVDQLASPFHVYNAEDVVPTVPPRMLGFADAPYEFRSSLNAPLAPGSRPGGMRTVLSRAYAARGIRHHFIERYIRRLGGVVGVH